MVIFEELGYPQIESIICKSDNHGVIDIATTDVYSKRVKHVDIFFFHFIRKHIMEFKTVKVEYVPSEGQLADPLTKALSPLKHYLVWKRLFKIA